jgi:glyoxylase-like metal-dependent hydrolase (beta-lactamase superfamily II)
MTRTHLVVALGGAAVVALVFQSQTASTQTAATHTFTQIAPGVYNAAGTGPLNVGSNSAVIVNADDVLIVDSHISPESARALINELPSITDKPVRFLVNTHFHYDHTNGNQVFPPATDIIGHQYTRKRLTGDILTRGMFAELLSSLPRNAEDLKARAAAEQDPTARTRLEQQVRSQQAFGQQVSETKPTPPTVTIEERMTLVRGDREIRLLYLGRGHTAGDLVVYLPKERVVCTGDLLVNQVANLVDGYVNDWPAALEKLRELDFVDVIPGHGEPFKGKERIDWFQGYLRDIWQQTAKLHAAGMPAAQAARRVDMTAHKSHYPNINGPGVPAAGIARIYAVLENRAE